MKFMSLEILTLYVRYLDLAPFHQLTPLHRAAQEGHADTVQYLIGSGDDINIKDGYGVSV